MRLRVRVSNEKKTFSVKEVNGDIKSEGEGQRELQLSCRRPREVKEDMKSE